MLYPLLSTEEKLNVLATFPTNIKLSYETMSHKKVLSTEYDICVAIPQGKRIYLWFINKFLFVLELSLKDNQIGNMWKLPCTFPISLSFGTIVAGYFIEETHSFVIDDIYKHKGVMLYEKEFPLPFSKKLSYLQDFFQEISFSQLKDIYCTVMWENTKKELILDDIITGYTIRYIQYRNSTQIVPHQNKMYQKQPLQETKTISFIFTENDLLLRSPIYKEKLSFWIKADIASDVYYLFAKDQSQQPIFYQYALIPNYQTSIWMNKLFRNIKENNHLDYIEDSEEDEEFENTKEDKYVYLDRILEIECVFNWKFKRWVPNEVKQGHIPFLEELIIKPNVFTKPHSNIYHKNKNGRHFEKHPFAKSFRR